MQASNNDNFKKHANLALSELIRNSDQHFLETAKTAIQATIDLLKERSQVLQKLYYEMMAESRPNSPKRVF